MLSSLCTLSSTELGRLIRTGQLSSVEAVDAHIAAIERLNGRLNAVVACRFEQARAEAKAADVLVRARSGEPLPVFHGVPCTVKESFALRGMPHSGGLYARRQRRASEDALTVSRLRRTGAIALGVTNLSELCMWMESDNPVYGRTSNPYDLGRTVGGSSGGEGAIIAAGGSPMGIGSDIGGSIRLPAFFCGIFGHKPTGGLVPCSGQFPAPIGDARRYITTGPLARKAEDLWPFLQAIAGPDPADPSGPCFTLGDPAQVRLADLQVLDVPDNGTTPVHPELRAAQRSVAEHLASRGARVRPLRIPALRQSLEIWGSMLSAAGGPSFAELMGEGHAVSPERELVRWLFGRSHHTFPAIALASLERLPTFTGERGQRYVAMGRKLGREIEALLGPSGVLLYPSYAEPAPRHGLPMLRPFRFVYTAIFNVLELPSTQVPLGLSRGSLPLGVQVVARRGNDHLTIAVAQELERAFGGWVEPAMSRTTEPTAAAPNGA